MTEFTFRRLVVGLLGLNTFLLFAFAGAAFVFFKVEPSAVVNKLPLAGEQLSKGDMEAFQRALNDARRSARDQSLAARQARIEAAALMGEPTLDANALRGALDQARDAEYEVRKATEKAAVTFAASLPLDARRKLAEGLLAREAPKPATK